MTTDHHPPTSLPQSKPPPSPYPQLQEQQQQQQQAPYPPMQPGQTSDLTLQNLSIQPKQSHYPPMHQNHHQQQPYQPYPQPSNQAMTTITATITTQGDQTRSIAFTDPQPIPPRPPVQRPDPTLVSSLPTNATAATATATATAAASASSSQQQQMKPMGSSSTKEKAPLTASEQREAEADENLQRAIQLHENNQLVEATHYFKLAAQSENPLGQLMYGLSLRHGWGCTANPKDSILYLQRAAEYAMGEMQELNPPSSTSTAATTSSTTAGQKTGQEFQKPPLKRMGTMDRKSALLTARKELVMALYELGMSFLKGWGVNKDKTVAFHYFKLAADLGDADSQNETALCFQDGIGTEKNMFESAKYYRLASAQGAAQMGNSWIWKPKYDQYCTLEAAKAAAADAARRNYQANAKAATAAAAAASGAGGATAQPSLFGSSHCQQQQQPPVSPTANSSLSIAAGLAASMTAGAVAPVAISGAIPTSSTSPTSSSSSSSSRPFSALKASLVSNFSKPSTTNPSDQILAGAAAAAYRPGTQDPATTTTAANDSTTTGAAGGNRRGQGRYSPAGDLISSSQLQLKIQQAQHLTQSTIGGGGAGAGPTSAPVAPFTLPSSPPADGSVPEKKKHRWTLFGHHLSHHRSTSTH